MATNSRSLAGLSDDVEDVAEDLETGEDDADEADAVVVAHERGLGLQRSERSALKEPAAKALGGGGYPHPQRKHEKWHHSQTAPNATRQLRQTAGPCCLNHSDRARLLLATGHISSKVKHLSH